MTDKTRGDGVAFASRSSAPLLLATLVLALQAGCGRREAGLRGLTLWEGSATCAACRAHAIDLLNHGRGPVVLAREATYTVEAQFDPGDAPDRCIYYMFQWATWDIQPGPPSHEFQCTPMDASVWSSGSTVGAGGEDGRLLVKVQEFDLMRRELVVEHFSREYEVTWAPSGR